MPLPFEINFHKTKALGRVHVPPAALLTQLSKIDRSGKKFTLSSFGALKLQTAIWLVCCKCKIAIKVTKHSTVDYA